MYSFLRFEYFLLKVFDCVNLDNILEEFLANLFISLNSHKSEEGGAVFSISVSLI